MRYSNATGDAVLRAYNRAAKRIMKDDDTMCAVSTDAGFIIPDGQKGKPKEGYQVFVKIARYSEKLLKARPCTGGLLENK